MASCLLCGFWSILSAQTNISGIINTYYQVTAFSAANNSMTVSNITGLASGDEILVIQMQGATVSQANTSAYGSISNYNGAGRHELARICEINGNEIVFDSILVHGADYAASGSIQLVSIPHYTAATVTATLTASPWDGSTGGVLILQVDGALTLNAEIEVDGLGFRGGGYENASSACSAFFPPTSYAYTSFDDGGKKGEGIVAYSALTGTYGKGPAANGGGGGNNHNAGGGGGGNGGAGGPGGENETTGFGRCKGPHPGVGGIAVATGNRIFLGGGSGSGHGNNNLGTAGSPGGGLVIIQAGSLTAGSSNLISANGLNGLSGLSDGCGGGGAGGSIHLEVGSFLGNIQLSAQGGNGGSVNNEGLNFCMGPGGGGGGGRLISSISLPVNVSTNLAGGSPGVSANYSSSCSPTNANNAATVGAAGSIFLSAGLSSASADFLCEPLAVIWGEIWAEQQGESLSLHAYLLFEEEENIYQVEKSRDGESFELFNLPWTRLSRGGISHYQWVEDQTFGGTWYYRIKQIDANGRYSYSPAIEVSIPYRFQIAAFPNPLASGQALFLRGSVPHPGKLKIRLLNMMGQALCEQNLPLAETLFLDEQWPLPVLSPGTYLLQIQFEGQLRMQKITISP